MLSRPCADCSNFSIPDKDACYSCEHLTWAALQRRFRRKHLGLQLFLFTISGLSVLIFLLAIRLLQGK